MKKIAILALNTGMGDVLLDTPLIEETKKKYPNSNIYFLTSNNTCASLLENNKNIYKIVIIPKKKFKLDNFFPFKGLINLLRLRKEKFDISINTVPHAYYGSFASIILGAKKRISNYLVLTDIFQNNRIRLRKEHDVLENIHLINEKYDKKPQLKIYLTKGEKRKKIRRNIGFHPGCDESYSFKRWSLFNFIRLAKNLHEKGYKITFFIGPSEKDMIPILKKEKNIEIINKSSLRETISRINQCEFFIGNDSGVTHIAEALNIPLLMIIGSSDYRRTGPIPRRDRIVITPENYRPWSKTIEGMGSEINLLKRKKENLIDTISVEKVLSEFSKLKKYSQK